MIRSRSVDLGRDRIVEIPDHVHDVLHVRLLGADVELVLDEPLDHGGRILRVDGAARADRARQQFGAVAGAGFHIEHLHPGPDAGEGQHLGGLAAHIGLPVGVAAVGRGDDGLIIPGVLRASRASAAMNIESDGEHADSACARQWPDPAMKIPLCCAATYQGREYEITVSITAATRS